MRLHCHQVIDFARVWTTTTFLIRKLCNYLSDRKPKIISVRSLRSVKNIYQKTSGHDEKLRIFVYWSWLNCSMWRNFNPTLSCTFSIIISPHYSDDYFKWVFFFLSNLGKSFIHVWKKSWISAWQKSYKEYKLISDDLIFSKIRFIRFLKNTSNWYLYYKSKLMLFMTFITNRNFLPNWSFTFLLKIDDL